MATTTTTTTTTQTLSILADYEVHHSGNDHQDEHTSPVTAPQPADWPIEHRRMPAYRPTNRNLPFEERPGGSNPAEMVFIQVMLHGVWLNAAVSRLWRFTGGRINDKIFHYDVGGEW